MKPLICDANVLIDIIAGGLAVQMSRLDFTYVMPDVMFRDEVREEQKKFLQGMNLEIRELLPENMEHVSLLSRTYPHLEYYDLLVLALAAFERCPLLTGDADLREVAESEDIVVKGTIWLVQEMMRNGHHAVDSARLAFRKMRDNNSRLPWDLVEEILMKYQH